MSRIFLGVVADDFTGASDAASFLVEACVDTVLFNGVPPSTPLLREGTEAVVVALKTRTEPVEDAVRESLRAFEWLRSMGAEHLYLKYCSTFDSTDSGNIGPVADSVMERYGLPCTVLCPSLPVNGRTVKSGRLYVNGLLLEESHMKDHPLTPMRRSRIADLMEKQGKYESVEVSADELPCESVLESLLKKNVSKPFYVVPDFYEDVHGDLIAARFGNLEFLTGGSGLVGALGRLYAGKLQGSSGNNVSSEAAKAGTEGKALLLAGSCSAVTLRQIANYQSEQMPNLRIRPQQLFSGEQNAECIWKWLDGNPDPLVFSSALPEDVRESQKLGRENVAAKIEGTLSSLAEKARAAGYTRFIIAGGETSGAVVKALGYQAFYIGPSVAPGVPVMTPLEDVRVRLVLKSGNFGQDDFFLRALKMTMDL